MESRHIKKYLFVISVGLILFGVELERLTRIDHALLKPEPSIRVEDRKGKLLRWIPNSRSERSIWCALDHIPEHVQKAFIAAEDKRFFDHWGFDLTAILRAAKDNFISWEIVSGASTITQQLIRMTYPRERTLWKKFIEALRAIRLERHLSKKTILELYLNRTPMGNNILGVQAASEFYFGFPPRQLTIAEAAVLAALPKGPTFLNPYGKHRSRLIQRKNWVLKRMFESGFITVDDFNWALEVTPDFKPKLMPFEAPHLINYLENRKKTKRFRKTTVDLSLQKTLESILRAHRHRLRFHGASQAAAVVLDNKTSEVLAMAGSLKYSRSALGYNNGATALRSPGSTLKPFLFAQALDSGFKTSTILEDVSQSYSAPQGIYNPVNFNRSTYGPVLMRTALGNSLNQSAIYLLNRVGYKSFYNTLETLDLINFPKRSPDYYGLGLVVGNPEVTLLQLVAAFSTFPNKGVYYPPRFYANQPASTGTRVFSPQASYIVSDILSDPNARTLTFGDFFNQGLPFKIALKTGTSTKYRDTWILGFTPEFTLGVWAGNFDGTPTQNLTGASAASPILLDLMKHLHPNKNPGLIKQPSGVKELPVCSISGMVPGPFCPHVKNELFMTGREPEKKCSFHSNDSIYHNLPGPFAGWLNRKQIRNAAGRYRLMGFIPRSGEKLLPDARLRNSFLTSLDIRITYPVNGDQFIPENHGKRLPIILKARTNHSIPELTWFIDGKEYETVGPPYESIWNLSQGFHEIMVTGPYQTGDSVFIKVD